MQPLSLIVGLVFLIDTGPGDAQTTATGGQVPGISIKFTGFTDLGEARVVSGFLTPATNKAILGPRLSTLPGPTNFNTRLPGGPAAVFEYTNSSPYPTMCAVQSIEYRTEAGWKAAPVPVVGMLLVGSNSVALQTLPVNATNAQWRITVFCVEQATGVPRAVERATELGREAITGQKRERFSGRKYLTTSLPPPSGGQPDGAANRSQPVGQETNRTSSAAGSGG